MADESEIGLPTGAVLAKADFLAHRDMGDFNM